MKGKWKQQKKQRTYHLCIKRVYTLGLFGLLAMGLLIFRLFMIQVLEHESYIALASGQYEIFQKLTPVRGDILVPDHELSELKGTEVLFPLAMNQTVYDVFIQPNRIDDKQAVYDTLHKFLVFEEDEIPSVWEKLNKEDDPYEPIRKEIEEKIIDQIKERELKGIGFRPRLKRYYPERELASSLIGFVREEEGKKTLGQYGLEGYMNEVLAGQEGHVRSERDALGRMIAVGERTFEEAVHGGDIVLTIDKTLQYKACTELAKGVEEFEAERGSVTIMDPQTGAILAMCTFPTFDPNEFSQVEDIRVYNNQSIFDAYEPGSIFKAITVAAAIDQKAVTPMTRFAEPGFIGYNLRGEMESDPAQIKNRIKNYKNKRYPEPQTVTQILENSINTGTVFVMQSIGPKVFADYVKAFGFGLPSGVSLDTEVGGDISSLDRKGEIFAATGSFGQGITVTPLQMVASYAAFANGGKLVKPYLISNIRHANGEVEVFEPEVISQVITQRTAELMKSVLVSVVDRGHAGKAGVKGFYIGGKTGTAQLAERGVYGEDTIHSFIGFGPDEDTKFVMLVRLDRPQNGDTSSQTSATVFGRIAEFIVSYYNLAPSR
jgi:cell division protein FtsI/penicillin-binding protein 2